MAPPLRDNKVMDLVVATRVTKYILPKICSSSSRHILMVRQLLLSNMEVRLWLQPKHMEAPREHQMCMLSKLQLLTRSKVKRFLATPRQLLCMRNLGKQRPFISKEQDTVSTQLSSRSMANNLSKFKVMQPMGINRILLLQQDILTGLLQDMVLRKWQEVL